MANSSAKEQSAGLLPRGREASAALGRVRLTTAAAMPAVWAAMAVAFLAFWKPSMPQDVRANGLLSKLTTWMWVLQEERQKKAAS